MANEQKYIHQNAAARIYGLCRQTIARLIRENNIPHIKLNRAILIDIVAIEAFFESKTIRSMGGL